MKDAHLFELDTRIVFNEPLYWGTEIARTFSDQATGWMTGMSVWTAGGNKKKDFPFSIAFRPALGPTEPSSQYVDVLEFLA